MSQDILKYESKVWATADLLIGAGIKQSDFPKYMMPFFALIMVESRFVRMAEELKAELEASGDSLELEDFIEEIKDQEKGYNIYLFEQNKTLADICKNDKTFERDFDAYLQGFDAETKDLLGVNKGNDEEKYLDISGISGLLNKKKILFATVKAWSEIDLKPFNNSEITTLEEHIKRKWADISAETAGEQYTPDDVIALISEIIASKIDGRDEFLTIYDPTCGGGNMLYGVEDRIREKFSNRPTATRGQDWNDALYALAKIESRFRSNSKIEYGNTLTNDKFDEEFDVVVANPPYGVDWKGYKNDIEKDKTGRFHALPAVSDGQLLFLQHIISKMALKGISIVIHNGSTLFSGDAGSGESEIRKWMFEQDIVEAIIQLPTDEFFNTGIYTYLWVLNKNKKHPNKVMLVNADDKFIPLYKSKGKKRKEIDEISRLDIVKTLNDFESNEWAKVFDKEFFYFNKQAIQLTNLDYQDKTIESSLKGKDKSIKLNPIKIEQDELVIDIFEITTFEKDKYQNLIIYHEAYIKNIIKELDYKEKALKVHTIEAIYYYDEDRETIIKQTGDKIQELGCGKIVIKSSYKKETKTKSASIVITVELTPDYQKDNEIIPFNKNEKENQKNIEEFMSKYITKPFVYLENTIGVEINFNKIFYKPRKLKTLESIIKDMFEIDLKIEKLYDELDLNNIEIEKEVKESNINWLGKIPKNWEIKRLKDIGKLYSGLTGKSGDDFKKVNHPNNKLYIPFTNIANNKYIKVDDLKAVIINDDVYQKKVKTGDLFFLMSSEGYADIGKNSLLLDSLEEVYLNSFCKGFRLFKIDVYNKYLNYLLLSSNFRDLIIIGGKGFTRINLKMEKINDLFIIKPEYKHQIEIANYLDNKTENIDAQIGLLEKKIESLKNLKETLINDIVTGKLKD